MVIMLDLDDTLLNKEGEISKLNYETLSKLQKEHLIVFNSARSYNATKKITTNFKPDYQILNSGSTIYDKKGNLIYSNPLSNEITNKIIISLKKVGITKILVEAGFGFVSDDLNFIATRDYVNYHNLSPCDLEAYKLVYHSSNKNIGLKLAHEFNLDFTTYINSNINKISKTTKGDGLKSLKKICHIKDKIIAFGDDLGDIPMLLLSDVPVIMANSQKELFNYNFNVTEASYDDGVAKFLIKYLKKKEGI